MISLQRIWNRLVHLPRQTKIYITVGSSVYLFELLVIFVAKAFGASDLLAVGLSFWLGLFASFCMQKFITFNNKEVHHRILLIQFIAFSLLVIFNFCFTLLVTQLLTGIVAPFISRAIALGITTIWNFYLYKIRIFKTKTPQVY